MENIRSKILLAVACLVALGAGFFLYQSQAEAPSPVAVNQISVSETKAEAVPDPLRILFGGDIFLDRSVRISIDRRGHDYIWANIEPLLAQFKYKVANLEGPIYSRPNPSGTAGINRFNFAFQPEYIPKLKSLGFTALSLANNHTDNQGWQALTDTRATLDQIGINHFGDPVNRAEFSFWKTELEGRKIAFVGSHDLVTAGLPQILTTITGLKTEGYFVIVIPHWGSEYVLEIPKVEQDRAYQLIDAGADLVMGGHPHVVQPIEIYKNKVIFYSLGNFLFDQYFSKDTMQSLLVEVVFGQNSLGFILHPTEQDQTYRINPASEATKAEMFARLAKDSVVPEYLRQNIASGFFTVPN